MLDNPNIVKLFEVLETDTNVFFVMELCGGGNLSDHIEDGVSVKMTPECRVDICSPWRRTWRDITSCSLSMPSTIVILSVWFTGMSL